MNEKIDFIWISDSHIGPTKDYVLQGSVTYPCFDAVVGAIKALPFKPDFVMHTGDVVTDPTESAYRFAAGLLEKIDVPIYFVNGNHDSSKDIRKYLKSGPCKYLNSDLDTLCYYFDYNGTRFITLDAKPSKTYWRGDLSKEQIEFLKSNIEGSKLPLAIFVHFSPVPLASIWLDEKMLLNEGAEVHALLRAAGPGRIRGVFFGHIHRMTSIVKDGILYAGCSSTCVQFNSWPNQPEPSFDTVQQPSFCTVSMFDGQTVIKEYQVPRPLMEKKSHSV